MGGIDLVRYLDSIGVQYKERGREVVFQCCPYCEQGQEKGNYSHFYFNQEKKTFYCQKCGTKGNLYRFMLDRGDVSPITKARTIEYKRPKENKSFTSDTDKFYRWYQETRGIDQSILEKYKVGFNKNNGDTHIVYQYYDQSGVLFNRKYKLEPKEKGKPPYYTEKQAESNFYGLQFVNFEEPYILVCEGEDDCHALVQMGFENVVSVPYGAGNYSPAMDKVLESFDLIFLLFDNDPPGQAGARKFAEKTDLFKCRNVILPFKDARECLLHGLNMADISKDMGGAEQFKHEEIVKANDLKKEFMDYINSEEKLTGKAIKITGFNRIVGGIRLSEMSILTGHTGSGKSTFAYNMVRWVEQVGFKCMIMSFENRLVSVISKLIEVYTGECIRYFDEASRKYIVMKDRQWFDVEYNRLDNRDIYFLNKSKHVKDGYYDINRMGQVIEYAVKFYDVNFFVVDHLHYFLKVSDSKNPVLKIDDTVRLIKQWTEKYNIHILLLVHPHMTQDDRKGNTQKLGLNCVKGSSSISQEADNFWVVSRKEDPIEGNMSKVRVLKNRAVGRTGDVEFYVKNNLNTYEALL